MITTINDLFKQDTNIITHKEQNNMEIIKDTIIGLTYIPNFIDKVEVKSFIDNSYWKHDIEDNAYAIMKDTKGRVAMLHSTATQWQHRFVMDIALTEGYIELHGILSGSKSYGEEKIIIGHRDDESMNGQMQSSTVNFLSDNSWRDEIFEFAYSILNNKPVTSGSSIDALETMKLVYNIYYNDIDWREKYSISNPKI